MKVAVVTDDGRTISQHFGRATYYEVLTVENGSVTGRERREKPAHQHHHHPAHDHEQGVVHLHEDGDAEAGGVGTSNTHNSMIASIQDCATVINRGMGRGAYDSLRGAGIEPIFTDVREIDEAVRQYLAGDLVDHPEKLH